MPTYTFLLIDNDARIVERQDRGCEGDAEALSAGEMLAGESGVEVWCGPRKVGEFKF
jgi:hypothetical protein